MEDKTTTYSLSVMPSVTDYFKSAHNAVQYELKCLLQPDNGPDSLECNQLLVWLIQAYACTMGNVAADQRESLIAQLQAQPEPASPLLLHIRAQLIEAVTLGFLPQARLMEEFMQLLLEVQAAVGKARQEREQKLETVSGCKEEMHRLKALYEQAQQRFEETRQDVQAEMHRVMIERLNDLGATSEPLTPEQFEEVKTAIIETGITPQAARNLRENPGAFDDRWRNQEEGYSFTTWHNTLLYAFRDEKRLVLDNALCDNV